MTPHDRSLVADDAVRLRQVADAFAREFYATLFELDPALRRLFPDDLAGQRTKLIAELDVLVAFEERAATLGRRHEVYGVEGSMYESVGTALVGALAETLPDFDDDHLEAWNRLYRVVAGAMRSS